MATVKVRDALPMSTMRRWRSDRSGAPMGSREVRRPIRTARDQDVQGVPKTHTIQRIRGNPTFDDSEKGWP
eukprot:6924605-Pyramimonas_sp.AAC.1